MSAVVRNVPNLQEINPISPLYCLNTICKMLTILCSKNVNDSCLCATLLRKNNKSINDAFLIQSVSQKLIII